MAFISALAVSLWKVDPPLELLLAGPVFALALYLRSSYRTVLAVRDAETDALTGLRQPPLVPARAAARAREATEEQA